LPINYIKNIKSIPQTALSLLYNYESALLRSFS
jgi:hypothetical protein